MAALLDDPLLDCELVRKKLNITATVIRALEEQHVLAVESEQVYRNPVHAENIQKRRRLFIRRSRNVRLCVSVRIMKRNPKTFAPWSYGQRKNRSLYGNDTVCCR